MRPQKTQGQALGWEDLKLSWEDTVYTSEYGFGIGEKNFSDFTVAC